MPEAFRPTVATKPESLRFPVNTTQSHPQRGLLLIEADRTRLSHLVSVLSAAEYEVTGISDLRELLLSRHLTAIRLALLSDTIGAFALRAAAETVRRQWPLARVLVLGIASNVLNDCLYDDQIRQHCEEKELLEAMVKLPTDSWQQRVSPGRSPMQS